MALDKFQPYLFVSAGEQSNKYLTPTITDGIAQFQAQRAQSLAGLTVRIGPIQEGTGDPSMTNIRPISGRTGMTVTVQSGDTQNTYPISWQTQAGTVYGGTLDVVSGVLTVNGVLHTLTGEEDFSLATNSRRFQKTFTTLEWERANTVLSTENQSNSRCSHATYLTGATGTATPSDYRISNDSSNAQAIYFYDTQSEFASATAFNAYLAEQYANGTPVQLYYDLATPLAPIQLSPTDVRTLAGFNQVYSDAGPVIDIQF